MKLAILLDLFIRFFKIGLVGFGGGWAIIPIIQKELVEDAGYISENEFYNLVAIAGSTPGPVAVNAATYVGFQIAGLPGAVVATMGVIIPPFFIISLIAYGLTQYFNNRIVQSILKALKATIIGLIIVVLYSTFRETVWKLPGFHEVGIALTITTIVILLILVWRVHPIIVILLMIGVGILLGALHVW